MTFLSPISGSTISTLLHDKINPKDCQVLPLGDSGFLHFFRVVSSDYGKPRIWRSRRLRKGHVFTIPKRSPAELRGGGVVNFHSPRFSTHVPFIFSGLREMALFLISDANHQRNGPKKSMKKGMVPTCKFFCRNVHESN